MKSVEFITFALRNESAFCAYMENTGKKHESCGLAFFCILLKMYFQEIAEAEKKLVFFVGSNNKKYLSKLNRMKTKEQCRIHRYD